MAEAVTFEEGGNWYALTDELKREISKSQIFTPRNPFAIKFTDGSIWDPLAGWR